MNDKASLNRMDVLMDKAFGEDEKTEERKVKVKIVKPIKEVEVVPKMDISYDENTGIVNTIVYRISMTAISMFPLSSKSFKKQFNFGKNDSRVEQVYKVLDLFGLKRSDYIKEKNNEFVVNLSCKSLKISGDAFKYFFDKMYDDARKPENAGKDQIQAIAMITDKIAEIELGSHEWKSAIAMGASITALKSLLVHVRNNSKGDDCINAYLRLRKALDPRINKEWIPYLDTFKEIYFTKDEHLKIAQKIAER